MKQTTSEVISNQEVMPGTYLMWLASQAIARQAHMGQFVMVTCGEETVLRRPLSIHSLDGDKLALLYQVVGKGTDWLTHLKTGNSVDILGPMGNGFYPRVETRDYLLIAGGIGIAPLRLLAEKVRHSCRQITLLHGAATAKKLYPKNLLPPEINLITATEDGSAGYKGLITEIIPNFISTADEVYTCGPLPMLKYMAENQKKLMLNNKRAFVSLEMRMGCGLGVCYGCSVRTSRGIKQVCKDGPVFPMNEIVWDELTCI